VEGSDSGGHDIACNDFESHNDLDLKRFLVHAKSSWLAVFYYFVPIPREHMSFSRVHVCGYLNDKGS